MRFGIRPSLVALALWASLGGCTIVDWRSFSVTDLDAGPVDQQLVVKVIAKGIDEARLVIDGTSVGTFPTNTFVRLDTGHLAQGEHLLIARAVTGRPMDDGTLTFQVVAPPPSVIRVDPPYGAVAGDAPLAIVIEFSEPVEFDDPTEPLGLSGPNVVRTVAQDRRAVRFDVAVPGTADAFSLHGLVRNGRGATLRFGGASPSSWTVQKFVGGFAGLDQRGPGLGHVTLHPYSSLGPGEPPFAEVLVNGLVIAQMGAPPWSPVDWDVSTLADGSYELSIRAPGYAIPSWLTWPRYVVDGTPPTASCSAQSGRVGELSVKECVYVSFSEDVDPHGGSITLLDDGVPIPASTWFYPGFDAVNVCPIAPRQPGVVEQVVADGFTDLAGNPISNPVCSWSVPPWFAPFGSGPLSASSGEFRAAGIGLSGSHHGFRTQTLWSFTLAWIVAAGAPGAGSLLVAGGREDDMISGPESVVGPEHGPSRPSISDDWMVFASRLGAGPGDVLAVSYRLKSSWDVSTAVSLDTVATVDADDPIVRGNPILAVWTEGVPGGARSLHGAAALVGYEVWEPLPGDPRGSIEGSVSSPALYVQHRTAWPDVALAVFLEAAPASAPRLRAASLEVLVGGWAPLVGDLDLGLGTPSDPGIALAGDVPVLAWIEDSQVRLRMGTLQAAGLSFGPALALNHDASRPARTARLIATLGATATLLFVEAGPAGDELWARRWDGSSWVLQPGPINVGTGDTIAELAADGVPDAQGVVAWTDAMGRVYLRVLNW